MTAQLRRGAAVLACLVVWLMSLPAVAAAEEDLRALDAHVDQAYAAALAGDLARARASYEAYHEAWEAVEDDVRARSPQLYRSVEDAMREVKVALATEPSDPQRVAAALLELDRETHELLAAVGAEEEVTSTEAESDGSQSAALLAALERVEAAIDTGDAATAASALREAQRLWPAVEGWVRARSAAVYTSTENAMAEASARLASRPPDLAGARKLVVEMRTALTPIFEEGTSYGVMDAAIIMLREGLEALLVIAALLAFLRRVGRTAEQRWIWIGSLGGVAASVAVAFGAQALFARAGAAIGSELVEGVVGLVAAAMLFYVSYWLHEKSRLGAWQRYIEARSTAALAGNSMLSLAAIAFLAVFREGAETVLFYLGIAPSISTADLFVGIVLGTAILAAVGVALLLLGLRLPLRPFFLASSLLIYYLGFKFVGTGIHALQVAGVLPATPAPLPTSEILGLFPTWQTAIPQFLLLVGAGLVLVLTLRRSPPRVHPAS